MKLLLLTVLIHFFNYSYSQGITEEQYKKSDEERTKYFESEKDKVYNLIQKNPEKKDSLFQQLHQIEKVELLQNIDSAIKYSSVPSGVQRLFWLRTEIPKNKLRKVYNSLPSDITQSEYGKYLNLYLQSKQCEIGNFYYDFDTIDATGKPFKISNLKSDYIMIIYDGLSCFGSDGLNFLKKLYHETDRNKIEFIQYTICKNQSELKEISEKYQTGFIDVSDFLFNESPLKIIYGAQATPTFIIIDKKRKVVFNSMNMRDKKFSDIFAECKLD